MRPKYQESDLREKCRGSWVIAIRHYHCINQGQLGRLLNVDVKVINDWEKNMEPVPTPYLQELYKIIEMDRMGKNNSNKISFVKNNLRKLMELMHEKYGDDSNINTIQYALTLLKKEEKIMDIRKDNPRYEIVED